MVRPHPRNAVIKLFGETLLCYNATKEKEENHCETRKGSTFLSSAYEICNKVSPVCNGHILYLYTNNTTKSVVEVLAEIKEQLNIDIQTLYDVQRVVNQINKFKPLSDETIFVKFKEFCSQEFSVIERGPLSETSSALHEAASNEVTIAVVNPLLEQSPQTRIVSSCQNCVRYRDVLEKERQAKRPSRIRFEMQRERKQREHQLKGSLARNKGNTTVQDATLKVISKLEQQSIEINALEDQLPCTKEKLDEAAEGRKHSMKGKKSYSTSARLLVCDALVNQVPTANIPVLIERFSLRLGCEVKEVPHTTTVEQIARELGVYAQLQTSSEILKSRNCTLAFDAATQEGVHINAALITTEKSAFVVAIDQLPGGTAEDYANHISDSVDELASVYTAHHPQVTYQETRKQLIDNISNTMTDRVATNHAAISLLNGYWGKSVNELNCHLHPLDSVSTCCRAALKKIEPTSSGALFGNDCIAGNIVLQVNKLRFKDGKGDPQGFVNFLDMHKLPRDCKDRDDSPWSSWKNAKWSWMKKFYVSAEDQDVNYVEGINVVKNVIVALEDQLGDPEALLSRKTCFFGNTLNASDPTLVALQQHPKNDSKFKEMVTACIQAVIELLKRQYKKFLDNDIKSTLEEESQSTRLHNIDCEELMGMFSAHKAELQMPPFVIFIKDKGTKEQNNEVY
eukprot:gene17193-18925_t